MAETPGDSFFVSCALGFEKDVMTEIAEVWPWLITLAGQPNQSPVPELTLHMGGVALQCPFELGLQLNFFLKTANRVLWRLAEFKVRDFPKLYEKVSKIPWNSYLHTSQVQWEVSAGKSRLNHEKRIEETCVEALKKNFRGDIVTSAAMAQAKNDAIQPIKIFVRIYDDLCSVSLDSSGEHLHKRGWGEKKGPAPLRETLSAFLLRTMKASVSLGELSQVRLVDPMCGSGTLLSEAASLWQPNFQRSYLFTQWKNSPKLFKTLVWSKNYKGLPQENPFRKYLGLDIDAKSLEAAKDNFHHLEEKTNLKNIPVEFKNENLFAGENDHDRPTWCICNPPYGERLYVQGQTSNPDGFSYQDLLERMIQKYDADRVGILLPAKGKNLKAPAGFKKQQELPLSNGGIEVVFIEVRRDPPKKR